MICAVDKKRKHNDSVILNCNRGDPVWCHRRCPGLYTHPCGCTVPCSCPGHIDDHAALGVLEDHDVPDYLTHPFGVPTPTVPDHRETAAAIVDHALDHPALSASDLDSMDLPQAVAVFTEAARRLLAAYDTDPEEPFHVLRELRRGRALAAQVDALLCTYLLQSQPYGEQIVEGIGPVRVRRTQASVHWDERGTAYAWIRHKMEEVGGEQVDPETVVDWLLEAAAIDYFRKKPLTAAGLDPSEFYTSTTGNPAVDLPKDG